MMMKMKLFWSKMVQPLGRLSNWLFSDWLEISVIWFAKNEFENPISDSDLFAKERQKLEKSENRKNDKSDCDVIESLKILNKADGQINFFPIIQKILLSSEFQSFDIRKTALPGTICIRPRNESSVWVIGCWDHVTGFRLRVVFIMKLCIWCMKNHVPQKLNANPFSKAILCSIEKHLETNFGHSLTDLGNSIILTLKVSFIF